jgi:hypothetical protein
MHRVLVWICLVLAVSTANADTAVRYRFVSTSNEVILGGSGTATEESSRTGVVIATADGYRVEIGAGDNPGVRFDALVLAPGEKEVALNRAMKTYHHPDAPAPPQPGGLIVVPGRPTERTSRTFECKPELLEEPRWGFALERRRLRLVHDAKAMVGSYPVRAAFTVEVVTTSAPQLEVAKSSRVVPQLATGDASIDGRIRECLDGLSGLVVEQQITIERKIEDGIHDRFEGVFRVEELELDVPVTPDAFAVPAGYRFEKPELVGFGGLSDG